MNKEELQKISDMLRELDQRAAFALKDQAYEEALEIYGQILAAQENLRLEKFMGHTLINMANVHTVLGNYDRALECLDRAAGIRPLQKDAHDCGTVQILRANIAFLQERNDEGEAILIQEGRRNRNDLTCGQIALTLFSYYFRIKKYPKARIQVDKAINHFRACGNREELGRALSCRAEYFTRMGQTQYARYDEAELAAL